ncbi:Na(+)/H(+) antiporter subunit B [Actinomadura napierensis]|uniref:MrpA C-terminal/MbhD domain-containing protein n=1 Tax=Actinomadura napierensis TaxID=267854 RepID=A0ABP5M9R1_9ACTN
MSDPFSGPLADALIVTALMMAAFMATAVVLTRDPARQAIVLSGYGMVLGVLFLVLQAPDVAMSQIGVGTVVVPLIVVLALHATRRHRKGGDTGEDDRHPDNDTTGTTAGSAGGAGGDAR